MTKITVPAAPKVDVGLNSLKYKLNKNLPSVKRTAVRKAPFHTDFQLISTSGSTLNISAKSTTTIPKPMA